MRLFMPTIDALVKIPPNCTHVNAFLALALSDSLLPSFQCPQQSKLKLPLSRVNDGICDCCDGVDEPEGTCPDICEEVLKEEREARAKVESGFKVGYNKRKHDLFNFKKKRQEKQEEIAILEEELASLPTDDLQKSLDRQKEKYAGDRQLLAFKVAKDLADLVDGLKEEELKNLIVHSCQLAGELSERSTTTCVPLRLAGLDMDMAWSEDNYVDSDEMVVKTGDSSTVDLLFDNALNENSMKWTLKGSRRRLEEYYEDTDDYDYHGDYTDDEFVEPYRAIEEDSEDDSKPPPKYRNRGSIIGKEKELMDSLKGMVFSKSRVAFIDQSKELAKKIDMLLPDDDDVYEKIEEEAKDEAEAPIDPVAYNMVKSTLGKTEDSIWKGFNWGTSAMLFFAVSPATLSVEELRGLAIGTLLHGNLGSVHVWQILQSILPELVETSFSPDTCASPWAALCPPKSITRIKGKTYPPSYLMTAAESFCMSQTEMAMTDETCRATKEGDDMTIPTSVQDGHFGYFAPAPRSMTDPLMPFFAPLLSLVADQEEVKSLKQSISDIEKKKKKIEWQITDAWKDIGGKEGDQLGPSGELYSMANECFSVVAGKYTYEVCLFNDAKQKDDSSSTKLGKWKGMDIEGDDGQRVMKWEGGQKCWNGPQRSATVYVTCGPETKLISADEPDTCCYVFEMDSHIACDEIYKAKLGISDV